MVEAFVNYKEDDIYFPVILIFSLSSLLTIFSTLDFSSAAHMSVFII
jgi:hypothetical protein